jgi:hypothetical protein
MSVQTVERPNDINSRQTFTHFFDHFDKDGAFIALCGFRKEDATLKFDGEEADCVVCMDLWRARASW